MQSIDNQTLLKQGQQQTTSVSNEIKANPIKEKQADQEEQIQSSEDLTENITVTTAKKSNSIIKSEFIACTDYTKREILVQNFPHLKSLDEAQQTDYNSIEDAYAFIMRSNNDDDIHKAIKYGIWSSTPPNNETLNDQFIKANKEGKKVFLFYSVVKSGQFVGVAELISNKHDDSFEFWWQHGRWKGIFQIKWLFIKDIPYKHFDKLQNSKDDPVIRSKDGTPVDWKKTGQVMMEIFKNASDANTIFNDFANMDLREQYLRFIKGTTQIQQNPNIIPNQFQPPNYQPINQQQQMYQYAPQYFGMQPQYFPQSYIQQQQGQRFNNAYPPQYYQQHQQYNRGGFYQQQSNNYYQNNNQGQQQRYGPRNNNNNYNHNRNNYYKNNNNYNPNNINNNNNNGNNGNNNGNNGYQNNPNYQGQKKQQQRQ